MEKIDIQIFKMQPQDVSEIKTIETQSGLSAWKEKDYLNEIERADSFCKIIRCENEISGFIFARLITTEDINSQNFAEIYNIAVRENIRQKGIGTVLLKDLIGRCIKEDIDEIWLEVRRSNKTARQFYKKYGFLEIAERKNYYYDPPEDAIIMKLDLNCRK